MFQRAVRSISTKSFFTAISKRQFSFSPVTVLNEEQEMLKESVRQFSTDVLLPHVRQQDIESQMHPVVLSGLFEMGLMGIEVPEEFGGLGRSFVDACIVIEEISKVDPAIAVMVDVHNTLCTRIVDKFGTPEQRETYLPRLSQEKPGSFCISESESGSDAFALKCKAEKVDGGYLLTGVKQWISNAKEAGTFLVFATTDPSLRHKGISCFVVEHDQQGLTIGKKHEKLGIRASSTCEVILDKVFVPDNRILGEIGKGYKVAIDTLNEGRIGIGAQMLGLAEGAFECAVAYSTERKQFGQKLCDHQSIRHQLAEMRVQIETARTLVYNAAALRETGRPFSTEAAIAKLQASRTAEFCASKSIEILGGAGFTSDFPVEKLYRDQKIGAIYEGTSNMQLETIGKTVVAEYERLYK